MQDWKPGPASIATGQYLQLRQTTDAVGGVTTKATMIAGNGAGVWTVSTDGDCATSPAVGTFGALKNSLVYVRCVRK